MEEEKRKLHKAPTKVTDLEDEAKRLAAAGQPATAGAGEDWDVAAQHLPATASTLKKMQGDAATPDTHAASTRNPLETLSPKNVTTLGGAYWFRRRSRQLSLPPPSAEEER